MVSGREVGDRFAASPSSVSLLSVWPRIAAAVVARLAFD
jgi:hypothetical protein